MKQGETKKEKDECKTSQRNFQISSQHCKNKEKNLNAFICFLEIECSLALKRFNI